MFRLRSGGLCPQCEKGRLEKRVKDITFNYKGHSILFQNQLVFGCDLCNYEGLTKKNTKQLDKKLTKFRNNINRPVVKND